MSRKRKKRNLELPNISWRLTWGFRRVSKLGPDFWLKMRSKAGETTQAKTPFPEIFLGVVPGKLGRMN